MIRALDYKLMSKSMFVLCLMLALVPCIKVEAISGSRIMYVISGNTGVGNVTLNGFPGGPIKSDETGYYSKEVNYNWSAVVVPSKEGYTFDPPSMRFDPVRENKENTDFKAIMQTFTIKGVSGPNPRSGVVLEGFPNGPVVLNQSGAYSVVVPYGWSGEVRPVLEGYEFMPATFSFSSVRRNMSKDFAYVAAKLMYDISGKISTLSGPVSGVILKGLPGDPKTRSDGSYSIKVDYNWAGSVTPTKDGYVFDPPSMSYGDLTGSLNQENYYGSVMQFTVTGNVGIPGVTINGLPGDVLSDSAGNYIATVNYGYEGKIVPEKPGYIFSPPQKLFKKVTQDLSSLNFDAQEIRIHISGAITPPIADVQLQGLIGLDGQMVVTDKQGRYDATVSYGWYGEVMPYLEGYTFSPTSKIYENLVKNNVMNYAASKIKLTVSGRVMPTEGVSVEGITLTGFNVRVQTNPFGEFVTQVPYGWTGKLTPTQEGLSFEPPTLEIFDVIQSQTDLSFTASQKKFIISGRIQSAKGGPVPEVRVSSGIGSDSVSVLTDRDGKYSLLVPYQWKGQIQFLNPAYDFSPPRRTISPIMQDMTVDVSAREKMFKILGEVVIDGEPLQGVTITATNGGGSDITNPRGQFMVEVPYDWSGELIPTKEGWSLMPGPPYANVQQDINERAGATQTSTTTQPSANDDMTPSMQDPFGSSSNTTDSSMTTDDTSLDTLPDDPFGTEPDINQGLGSDTSGLATSDSADTLDPEKQQLIEQLKEYQKIIREMTSGDPNQTDSKPAIDPFFNQTITSRSSNTLISEDSKGPGINLYVGGQLSEVLVELATEAGVPIIYDPEIQGMVDVDFTGDNQAPLEQVLDTILAGSGYAWKKTPYYYLVSSIELDARSYAEGSETRRIKLAYISGALAKSLIGDAYKRYVQADAEGGRTVMVTAPPSFADRIIKDLKMLDRKPRQVLLDARIVAMEKGNLLNLGVEWGWPTIRAGIFGNNHKGRGDPEIDFGGATPWGFQIGYSPDGAFTEALAMQLNLLEENEEAKIVANPQVMAQDGRPAEIRVVREEYFMMSDPAALATGFYTQQELEKVESGTVLEITPHISDNNDIVLILAAELSDSVPRGRESDLPIVTRRTTRNEVIVKDGGTVAIAGLQQHESVESNKSVPGLSKIPLFGKLFSSDNNTGESREIAIFVTARLIPEFNTMSRHFQQQTPPPQQLAPAQSGMPVNAPVNQPTNMPLPSDNFQQELMGQIQNSPRQ